jgi:hypothetical protein
MTDFKYAVLPNGDWFVSGDELEALIAWAGINEFLMTIPGAIDDDTELYGAIIRYGLRDVYIIPEVLERQMMKA